MTRHITIKATKKDIKPSNFVFSRAFNNYVGFVSEGELFAAPLDAFIAKDVDKFNPIFVFGCEIQEVIKFITKNVVFCKTTDNKFINVSVENGTVVEREFGNVLLGVKYESEVMMANMINAPLLFRRNICPAAFNRFNERFIGMRDRIRRLLTDEDMTVITDNVGRVVCLKITQQEESQLSEEITFSYRVKAFGKAKNNRVDFMVRNQNLLAIANRNAYVRIIQLDNDGALIGEYLRVNNTKSERVEIVSMCNFGSKYIALGMSNGEIHLLSYENCERVAIITIESGQERIKSPVRHLNHVIVKDKNYFIFSNDDCAYVMQINPSFYR